MLSSITVCSYFFSFLGAANSLHLEQLQFLWDTFASLAGTYFSSWLSRRWRRSARNLSNLLRSPRLLIGDLGPIIPRIIARFSCASASSICKKCVTPSEPSHVLARDCTIGLKCWRLIVLLLNSAWIEWLEVHNCREETASIVQIAASAGAKRMGSCQQIGPRALLFVASPRVWCKYSFWLVCDLKVLNSLTAVLGEGFARTWWILSNCWHAASWLAYVQGRSNTFYLGALFFLVFWID
jgi:hypothetical protein